MNMKQVGRTLFCLLLAGVLIGLFFDREDKDDMFLRNIG
jgi:hypothetical protein